MLAAADVALLGDEVVEAGDRRCFIRIRPEVENLCGQAFGERLKSEQRGSGERALAGRRVGRSRDELAR